MNSTNTADFGIQDEPTTKLYSADIGIFLGTTLFAIVFVTVAGNLLVIIAFLSDDKLRQTVRNFYLFNLALADLMVGLMSMPFDAFWALHGYGDWPLGEGVCKLWITSDFIACSVSVVSIIFVSLDRYWLVKKKARYALLQKRNKALTMCVVCWVLLILYYGITILGWTAVTGERNLDYKSECEAENVDNLAFNMVTFILEFVIPVSVIAYLNMNVYLYLRKQAKERTRSPLIASHEVTLNAHRLRKNTWTGRPGGVRFSSKVRLPKHSEQSEELSVCESIQDRGMQDIARVMPVNHEQVTVNPNSQTEYSNRVNAVLEQHSQNSGPPLPSSSDQTDRPADPIPQYKKENKALKTLSILVIVFVCCWLPYNLYLIMITVCSQCFNDHIWNLVNWLLWCNSTVNPLLYAVTSPRFRYRFKQLLCCGRKSICKNRIMPQ
ncbi:muscarinic acetylcholine receptor M4-like [Glandiceps talaboti]